MTITTFTESADREVHFSEGKPPFVANLGLEWVDSALFINMWSGEGYDAVAITLEGNDLVRFKAFVNDEQDAPERAGNEATEAQAAILKDDQEGN